MKNRIRILMLFVVLSFFGSAQIDSVRSVFNEKLIQISTEINWKIDKINPIETVIYRADSFSVCSKINPIRSHKSKDTLFIKFRFEKGWSKEKIDSIELLNLKILNPIIPKYINYYDSAGWGKARVKKNQLLEQPKFSVLQDWNKSRYISEKERTSLFSLIRIPDTLISTVGVFHNRNFPPHYFIAPNSLEMEVDILLDKLNKEVLPISTILRNEGFYLKAPFEELK